MELESSSNVYGEGTGRAHCISTKTGKSARIVSRCLHVGTIGSRTRYPRDDAEAKANSALTSYHQLAHSVFRNSRISLHLREQSCEFPVYLSLEIRCRHLAVHHTHRHSTDSERATAHWQGIALKTQMSRVVTTPPMRWHWNDLPTDLVLLTERRSSRSRCCARVAANSGKTLRRAATGAMKTLLEDLRWVRVASTTLRWMPEPVPPT